MYKLLRVFIMIPPVSINPAVFSCTCVYFGVLLNSLALLSVFSWLGSSVWVTARSSPSQVPPLLMHVGKWLAALLATKRLACVALEVNLRECTLHLPLQKSYPLWLWNPEEMSPEIQNRVPVAPKKDMCLPKTLSFLNGKKTTTTSRLTIYE